MKRGTIIGLILLIIAVIIVQQIITTKEKATSAQNPKEEFYRARSLLGDNRVNDAITILNNIIKDNPGSEIAASCHFELAKIYGLIKNDNSRMIQEFQTVAYEYSGTPYEIQAKSFLIDCNYLKPNIPFDTYLQKKNELLVEFGGISISDILKEDDVDKDDWWEKLKSLAPNNKYSIIPSLYSEIACHLSSPEINRMDDSLKLHIFVRTYFPKYPGSWDEIESISNIIMDIKGISDLSDYSDDTIPPDIRPIAPKENLTIGDNQPKIEVELTAGDIAQFQMKLDQVVFTLDGEDLTNKMSVRIHINKSANKQANFETIRLKYKPNTPLYSGIHTVYVKAVTAGPKEIQASEKTWSFNIK